MTTVKTPAAAFEGLWTSKSSVAAFEGARLLYHIISAIQGPTSCVYAVGIFTLLSNFSAHTAVHTVRYACFGCARTHAQTKQASSTVGTCAHVASLPCSPRQSPRKTACRTCRDGPFARSSACWPPSRHKTGKRKYILWLPPGHLGHKTGYRTCLDGQFAQSSACWQQCLRKTGNGKQTLWQRRVHLWLEIGFRTHCGDLLGQSSRCCPQQLDRKGKRTGMALLQPASEAPQLDVAAPPSGWPLAVRWAVPVHIKLYTSFLALRRLPPCACARFLPVLRRWLSRASGVPLWRAWQPHALLPFWQRFSPALAPGSYRIPVGRSGRHAAIQLVFTPATELIASSDLSQDPQL